MINANVSKVSKSKLRCRSKLCNITMLIVIIIVGVIIILAILAHAASKGGATGRLWSATTRIVTCAGFVNGGIEKALLLWDSAHSLNLTW